MTPGRFKPHRACSIQCLSGGIPPLLAGQARGGELAHYLPVGVDGTPVNGAIIESVVEPVELNGLLKTVGDRRVVYLDPSEIKRLYSRISTRSL